MPAHFITISVTPDPELTAMSIFTTLPRERYSAAAFDQFDATRGDFNLGTGKAMAWACQLAYETTDPTPGKIDSIAGSWKCTAPVAVISENSATVLPTSSTQLIVFVHGDAVIISFAGTDPVTLVDWITDFDIKNTDQGSANGFAIAAQSVQQQIEAVLVQPAFANKPIFVTGHSLGGALAALTAQRIDAANPGSVRAVYTYGMPRTGNAQFASAYNQALGARTYRMVHGSDVVPTVPPALPAPLAGPRHVGRFLHCARLGKFDAGTLAPTTGSDEPNFVKGISAQLHHAPLSEIMSFAARAKLAAALTLGVGPAGLRTDLGGIAIELLPPPLRDHMPDRYIGGF
jgi:pimeloyl-ACP methyl ester carboxylesterase